MPIQSKPLLSRGYTLQEQIGEGSFGVIMMARSSRHHCQMAIKVIEKPPNDKNNNCGIHWSIKNEKKFAYTFDHPYINVYHEIIETTKRFYFIMDYYKNGTLLEYFNEVNYTPETTAYQWFAQLCSALQYVHGHRFAHRDVKMDNVLLDHRWRVRLADFGMCVTVECPRQRRKHRQPQQSRMVGCGDENDSTPPSPLLPTVNRSVCGSMQYMSPELLAHKPYHGQLADVWAAGVLLYCLVVGRFPFTGLDIKQVILSQKEGHYFNQDETLRLSKECRMFFKNIFISEKKRKEISDLKNEEWMTKMSQLIDIPYFEK